MSISFSWIPSENSVIDNDFFQGSNSLASQVQNAFNGKLIFTFLPPGDERSINLNPRRSSLWCDLLSFRKAGGISRYDCPCDWSEDSESFCIKKLQGTSDSAWIHYLMNYRVGWRDGEPEGADEEEYGPADYRCKWGAPVLGLFRKIDSTGGDTLGEETFYSWGSISWGEDSTFYWTDGTRKLTFLGVWDEGFNQYVIFLVDYLPATWWIDSGAYPFQNGGDLPLALIGYPGFLPTTLPRNKKYSVSTRCRRAHEA